MPNGNPDRDAIFKELRSRAQVSGIPIFLKWKLGSAAGMDKGK